MLSGSTFSCLQDLHLDFVVAASSSCWSVGCRWCGLHITHSSVHVTQSGPVHLMAMKTDSGMGALRRTQLLPHTWYFPYIWGHSNIVTSPLLLLHPKGSGDVYLIVTAEKKLLGVFTTTTPCSLLRARLGDTGKSSSGRKDSGQSDIVITWWLNYNTLRLHY